MPQQERKLMDRVRDRIRIKHYSKNTESTYVHWILQYILFHDKRHPAIMGKPEIEAYLSHLAQNRRLSASSQNQAFRASHKAVMSSTSTGAPGSDRDTRQ